MPEGLTPEQAAFWAAFLASSAAPPDAEGRFHSAFGVGSGTDEGAALILSGRKTATSALPTEFAPGTPPVPGSLSLLYASNGRPVAIIETLSILPLSLDQMQTDFISAYAEWDSPDAFRQGMLDWYRAQDPAFTAQTPLLCERFRVLWAG
ncbi:MAG: Peroxyureidoacrylate/ureidoacrylate amidohydrolase RutB [Pseudomonadota bacterium]|jgi:uncharacterized protein YhfF